MKKIRLLIAAAVMVGGIAVVGSTATPVAEAPATLAEAVISNVEALVVGEIAEAGLSECSVKRNFLRTESTCYSLTAGGNQHQRAFTTCFYYVPYGWRTYYGPTVGVLQTSPAVAASGGSGCYGGYQLRP
jgi:hypothetical protein